VSEQHPKEKETVSKTYDIFSFQAPERKDESTEAGIGTGTGVRIGIGAGAGGSKSYRPPPDSEKTSKAINDRKPKFRKISVDKGKGEYHRSVAVHCLGDVV
jgi:hypothetical protein